MPQQKQKRQQHWLKSGLYSITWAAFSDRQKPVSGGPGQSCVLPETKVYIIRQGRQIDRPTDRATGRPSSERRGRQSYPDARSRAGWLGRWVGPSALIETCREEMSWGKRTVKENKPPAGPARPGLALRGAAPSLRILMSSPPY